jgi:hypothetical protein
MTDPANLKHLPADAMAKLGLPHLAYVKAVEIDGETGYAVYAADGNQMAVMADRDTAWAAILQHDMQPMSVH